MSAFLISSSAEAVASPKVRTAGAAVKAAFESQAAHRILLLIDSRPADKITYAALRASVYSAPRGCVRREPARVHPCRHRQGGGPPSRRRRCPGSVRVQHDAQHLSTNRVTSSPEGHAIMLSAKDPHILLGGKVRVPLTLESKGSSALLAGCPMSRPAVV